MSGPSQPKVEGEEWSDERIAGFLTLTPRDETHPDYHILKEAYQHMTPEFFERFVVMFKEAGKDIDAPSLDGESLLKRISAYGRSAVYQDVLRKAGASA